MILDINRRIKIINAQTLCIIFIIISQFTYTIGDPFFYTKEKWVTFTYIYDPYPTVLYYFMISLSFYCSTLRLRVSRTSSVKDMMESSAKTAFRYNALAAALVYIACFLHLIFIDHSLLLFNDQYILLRSSEAMRIPIFGGLLQSMIVLCGLISGFFLAIAISYRNISLSALWLLPTLWIIIFFLSDASRTAFLIISELFILLLILNKSMRIFMVFAYTTFGYISLSVALNGRGLGHFGITSLPFMVRSTFSNALSPLQVLGNVFQGILSTSEGVEVKAHFNILYKILSFSPLPSVVDHFDFLLDRYQIRLFSYVPMSALAEIYHFGAIYMLFFMICFCFMMRYVIKKSSVFGASYLLMVFLIFAAFVMAGAYPVRTTFRVMTICAIIIFAVRSYSRRLARNKRIFQY